MSDIIRHNHDHDGMVVGNRASTRAFKVYLAASVIAGTLMGTAGYWGGELLLNG